MQRCNNHNRSYTCPDFDFDGAAYLKEYKSVAVIYTEISSKSVKEHPEKFQNREYNSAVLKNYTKHISEVKCSMYIFNTVKDHISEDLLLAEKKIPRKSVIASRVLYPLYSLFKK